MSCNELSPRTSLEFRHGPSKHEEKSILVFARVRPQVIFEESEDTIVADVEVRL